MRAPSDAMQAQVMEARDRVIASAGGDLVSPFLLQQYVIMMIWR
jgi:hypothetical protein